LFKPFEQHLKGSEVLCEGLEQHLKCPEVLCEGLGQHLKPFEVLVKAFEVLVEWLGVLFKAFGRPRKRRPGRVPLAEASPPAPRSWRKAEDDLVGFAQVSGESSPFTG